MEGLRPVVALKGRLQVAGGKRRFRTAPVFAFGQRENDRPRR